MADPWNGKPLLRRSGGQQGTCAAEQYSLYFPVPYLIQKESAKCYSAASAAGAAGMRILSVFFKNQLTAVCQFPSQSDTISAGKLQKHFLSQMS